MGTERCPCPMRNALKAFWAACSAIKQASERSPRSWWPWAMAKSCSAWRNQRSAASRPGFIDYPTLFEGAEDKGITLLYHLLEFIRCIHQDVGVHARRAQLSHSFQAFHKWRWRLFNHQHIQIAFRIGLAAGGRAEEDDALGLIELQSLQ